MEKLPNKVAQKLQNIEIMEDNKIRVSGYFTIRYYVIARKKVATCRLFLHDRMKISFGYLCVTVKSLRWILLRHGKKISKYFLTW